MGPGTEAAHRTQRIVCNAPVGTDDTVIAFPFPEQVINDVSAVGVAYVFSVLSVLIPADRVIRHHGGRLAGSIRQTECTFRKGPHMLLKSAAGINGIFSVGIVGIPAAFSGTAAGPVLHHGSNTVLAPALRGTFGGLQTVTVGLCEGGDHFRVGTHGIFQPHPPGFRSQIDLGTQGLGDAQSPVFFCDDPRKLLHQLHIEGSRHAQTFRPAGDFSAGAGEFRAFFTGSVPGIRGNAYRHTKGRCFCQGLEPVVPPGSGFCGFRGHQQDIPQMLLRYIMFLFIRQCRRIGNTGNEVTAIVMALEGQTGHERHQLMGRPEHEARDLFQRKPLCQVFCPGLIRKPPVLIWQQFRRSRQVFEGITICFLQPKF